MSMIALEQQQLLWMVKLQKTLTSESKKWSRNIFFLKTLLKGYKYMNSPIKEDGSFLLSEKEFEDLAAYKQGDEII